MISCIPLMVMTGMMWFPDCWETLCCKIWPIQNQPCTGSYYASLSRYQGFYHLLMFIVLFSTRRVGLGCCRLTDGSPEVHRDQGEKHFPLTRSGADCRGHCCQSVFLWVRKQRSMRETACCASVISTWNAKHKNFFLCFTLEVDSVDKICELQNYNTISRCLRLTSCVIGWFLFYFEGFFLHVCLFLLWWFCTYPFSELFAFMRFLTLSVCQPSTDLSPFVCQCCLWAFIYFVWFQKLFLIIFF